MGALLDDDDEWCTGNGYSGVVLKAVARVLFFCPGERAWAMSGVKFLGRGQPAPYPPRPPARGLGNAVSQPAGSRAEYRPPNGFHAF